MFGNKRIILYIMVVLMTIGSTSYAASDLNEEANYLNALGILRVHPLATNLTRT